MKILEQLVEKGEMSILELTESSGMGKSTVHRILGTFKSIGYVDQNKDNLKYFPTLKIFQLGTKASNRIPLKKIIRPYLQEIFDKCHETVNFGIVDSGDLIYLDKIVTSEPLRVDLEIGNKVSAYCTGIGKAILAFTEGLDISKIDFVKKTENTVDSPEKFLEQLEFIRKNGYSVEHEEYIPGLTCIAVPLKSRDGRALAGISISVPSMRLNEKREKEIVRLLLDTVKKIDTANY
ncbi:MAG: transcriptional regulator, IclR family [Firmicutes bacterium]|nr:transcriptional regulator, IclR family [Bacillota bacterium]